MSPANDRKDLRRLHLWQIQGVRDVVLVSAVVALVWVGYAMRAVTVPVLVAFAFAYLVEPLVHRMSERWRIRRSLAVTVVLVTALVGAMLATTLAVPIVWGQTNALIQELRTRRFQQLLREAEQTMPTSWREPLGKVVDWLESAEKPELPPAREPGAENDVRGAAGAGGAPAAGAGGAGGALGAPDRAPGAAGAPETVPGAAPGVEATVAPGKNAEGVVVAIPIPPRVAETEEARIRRLVAEQVTLELNERGVGAPASTVPSIPFASLLGSGVQQVVARVVDVITLLFLGFLVPFYFYFFSVSYPEAIRFLHGLVPEQKRERVAYLAREMDRAVSGFVRGRIVIALLMGVMTAIGWKFCGVPYAITLGLAAGVLSIVPYLGFAAVPVAVGMLLLDQVGMPAGERMAWYWIIGGPFLVFAIVQVIEGNLLTPIIAGKVTGLGPVMIFVAVLAGASIAGVYGMLLSIPAAACLKIYWREVILPRIKDWSAGRRADPLPLDE